MSNYESEALLEKKLIDQLVKQGFPNVSINNVADLESNFRKQVNIHNKVDLKGNELSDKEFDRLLTKVSGKGIFESAKLLREKQDIQRDDGSIVYIELFNKKDWCKNIFQVTHQTTVDGEYTNRYDVTILINGLPLVQVELKRRGCDMKDAFNQIQRYKKHSYRGLYRFIQLFIISNGIDTKYFANSDGDLNYGFTFFWTDINNDRITNLQEFTMSFLEKCHVSKVIARYMVLNQSDKALMVMRPYQVYAVEAIVDRAINTSNNGYVWHTTGSGKTLTSFKTSQILSLEEKINRVFFLVDRNDLDSQTTGEFNKFDPGCVDMTDNTDHLINQIKDSSKKVIITTIQKMTNAVKNPKYVNTIDKHKDLKTIFIIDECHRSQFGDMHKAITTTFTQAQYFGFTGTPRFEDNKSQDGRTTADIFGKGNEDKKACLHTYLIKDAIKDGNVLGFSVDYIKTFEFSDEEYQTLLEKGDKSESIDIPEVFLDNGRIAMVANHIIAHHDNKTRNKKYGSLFAVSSIPMLIKYYDAFKTIDHNLKICAIFTYGANESLENKEEHSRDSLERVIKDYNKQFKTNYSTHTFGSYFADLCKKIKNSNIDIVLVVDMLLTGFDAKMLNTLYIDKPLKFHNLIQAFSRTNRIESDTKPHGNIVCYQIPTKHTVDSAVKLFSQTDSADTVIMEPYEYYLNKFNSLVKTLHDFVIVPEAVDSLEREDDQEKFVTLFKQIAKTLISLKTFNEFSFDNEDVCMNTQEFEDFKSQYYKLYRKIHAEIGKDSILAHIDFSLELIQTDKINVQYILNLIRNIDLSNEEQKQRDIQDIEQKLQHITDDELYLKADLIRNFISRVIPVLTADDSIDEAFDEHMNKERMEEIQKYAKTLNILNDDLMRVINEYEYSGIFPDDMIYDVVKAPYKEKRNIVSDMKIFIKNVLRKYM